MPITVMVNGAHGKMGRIAQAAIQSAPDLMLCAIAGEDDDLAGIIEEKCPDIVVDFTVPSAVFSNTQTIINLGAHPIIGTTGLSEGEITTLTTRCADKKLGAMIVPNFSVSAILMMRYAQDAARYFPNAEIIEMHHPQKVDAPSGTAIKTAQMIEQSRERKGNTTQQKDAARGDHSFSTPIHAVRLPGMFSHQMVIFSADGERLTITHDATDRSSMSAGIMLACREVVKKDTLIYGLESVLSTQ